MPNRTKTPSALIPRISNDTGLHLAQRLRAAGEALDLDAELVEHGKVEVCGRQLTEVHLAAPAGVRTNAGGRLVLVVALTVLEVLSVLKSQLATTN